MIIAVDFDGTVVTHEFPAIGEEIGATEVLKELIANGHQLILYTMRSDIENPTSTDYNITKKGGTFLTDAINWFKERDVTLYGINTNPEQKNWTDSPKAYAELYIDDASLGCPLVHPADSFLRPYVDWVKVREILIQTGVIDPRIYESQDHQEY